MTNEWDDESPTLEARATAAVTGLIRLTKSDDALRLLGVDGTLEDEVDITFLVDPLNWIASEIANGLRLEGEDAESEGGSSLSNVVALLRLCSIVRGAPVTEEELREAVLDFLDEDEEEEFEN